MCPLPSPEGQPCGPREHRETYAVEELSHVLYGLQLLQEQAEVQNPWDSCPVTLEVVCSSLGDPAMQKEENSIRSGHWLAFVTALCCRESRPNLPKV